LWQSAPQIEFTLTFRAPAAFELRIDNCMPGATLRQVQGAPLELQAETTELLTQRRYRVAADAAGEVRLSFGPDAPVQVFRVALLSDVQEAIDGVGDVFQRINQEPDVEFLLGAGDLTEQGSHAELARFESELRGLSVPYYTTLGNHELGASGPPFQERFGRGSFSFVYRGARFTLLDSASATLDPLVYEWLDEWLSRGRDAFHVVAMHIPPIDPIGVRNGSFASRNEAFKFFTKLNAGAVDLTLYGHIHSYYRFENGGIEARISGGGGAIPERFDRIGRHFLTLDIDPNGQRFESTLIEVD
jgi:hypothetical protein